MQCIEAHIIILQSLGSLMWRRESVPRCSVLVAKVLVGYLSTRLGFIGVHLTVLVYIASDHV